MKIGLLSMTATSLSRRRSTRSGCVTPNTARQITSKVSARMRSRSTSCVPGRQLAISRSATSRMTSRKRGHPRALERREQELSLAQVLGPVEHQHRVRPEHRLHERVGLAGAQVGLIAREQLADRVGIDDVDARAEAGHPHGEHVAVARLPLAQQLERPAAEAHDVDEAGVRGPGGSAIGPV